MGKIYMIGSQKGGTAKTTTTFNLAYCLRKMGKRVLAVDFDSQANLTTCFEVEDTGVLDNTTGHLMMAHNTRKYHRSRVAERIGKSPLELLTGKEYPEFLEALGY